MLKHFQIGGLAEDDEDPTELGALGQVFDSLSTTTPEAKQQARGILSRYQDQSENGYYPSEQRVMSGLRSNAEAVRQALRTARERISAERRPISEILLGIAAGLGQPTRFGTIGESASNVAQSTMGPLSSLREFDRNRTNDLLKLNTALATSDNPVLEAELKLSQIRRQSDARLAQEALKTLGRTSGTAGARGQLRQQKILGLAQRFLEQGIDSTTAMRRATDVVDGNVKIEVVPQLGVVRGTDVVNQRAWEVPLESVQDIMGEPPPPEPPGTPGSRTGADEDSTPADIRDVIPKGDVTLWDAALYGTGLWSGLRAGYNVPAGWLHLPRARRTALARQSLRTESQEFVRSLAVNSRFPVGEQNRIREEIATLPALVDSPQDMRDRMISIDNSLRRRMQQALADSNDVTLPQDVRSSQAANAAAIRRFLPRLGVPGESRLLPDQATGEVGTPGPVRPSVDQEAEFDTSTLPPEVQGLWEFMDPEDQEKVRIYYSQGK